MRIKKKNIGGYFIEISIKDQNKIPTYFSFYQTASKQSRYKTQVKKKMKLKKIYKYSHFFFQIKIGINKSRIKIIQF